MFDVLVSVALPYVMDLIGKLVTFFLRPRNLFQILVDIVALVALAVVFWFVFPAAMNLFLFQYFFLHIFWLIPIGLTVPIIIWGVLPNLTADKKSLAIVYSTLAVIVCFGGIILIETGRDYKICQLNLFTERKQIVEIDKKSIRFTPTQVAYTTSKDNLNSSQYTVDEELINAVDINGGFGYVTPITPDDVALFVPVNTFIAKNKGFMVYDDRAGVEKTEIIDTVDQTFNVGENMEFLDNVWRHLYQKDMFSRYDNIYYLQLNPENPREFTGVAPKIKFEYHFPCFFVPYWAGVTLIHADGEPEELSVEQAQNDDRLKNRKIFPRQLALKYVKVQIYDEGYLGAFYNREGKIQVPKLPGKKQMPFFTQADSRDSHFVVLTEPSGDTQAVNRIYYVNTFTGARTVFKYGLKDNVLGVVAAIDYVKTLRGFKWVEGKDGEETGDHRIIEPVYLTRDGQLHIKYTITPKAYRGITMTVVVNAVTKDLISLKTRSEFDRWLSGEDIRTVSFDDSVEIESPENTDGAHASELAEVKKLLNQALEKITVLEQQK